MNRPIKQAMDRIQDMISRHRANAERCRGEGKSGMAEVYTVWAEGAGQALDILMQETNADISARVDAIEAEHQKGGEA